MWQIVPNNRLGTLFLQCVYLNLRTCTWYIYHIFETILFQCSGMSAKSFHCHHVCFSLFDRWNMFNVIAAGYFRACLWTLRYFTKERAQLRRSSNWPLVHMCICFWEHLGFVMQTFSLVKRLLISLELLATGWCIHEYLHLSRWTTFRFYQQHKWFFLHEKTQLCQAFFGTS